MASEGASTAHQPFEGDLGPQELVHEPFKRAIYGLVTRFQNAEFNLEEIDGKKICEQAKQAYEADKTGLSDPSPATKPTLSDGQAIYQAFGNRMAKKVYVGHSIDMVWFETDEPLNLFKDYADTPEDDVWRSFVVIKNLGSKKIAYGFNLRTIWAYLFCGEEVPLPQTPRFSSNIFDARKAWAQKAATWKATSQDSPSGPMPGAKQSRWARRVQTYGADIDTIQRALSCLDHAFRMLGMYIGGFNAVATIKAVLVSDDQPRNYLMVNRHMLPGQGHLKIRFRQGNPAQVIPHDADASHDNIFEVIDTFVFVDFLRGFLANTLLTVTKTDTVMLPNLFASGSKPSSRGDWCLQPIDPFNVLLCSLDMRVTNTSDEPENLEEPKYQLYVTSAKEFEARVTAELDKENTYEMFRYPFDRD